MDCVQSKDVWFDDGSLIIEVQNVLYRVSRSILSGRSSVFADMFSIPQPADAETRDGCPVVHLHDASADLTVFLRAIFDSEYFMPYPVQTDFRTASGVLRLSNKYAVDYLRRRALVHLSSVYPTKLSALDAGSGPNASAWVRPSWRNDVVPIHVAAIVLAREVDAPWIIPYAFYRAATTDDKDLVQDVLRPSTPNGWITTLNGDDRSAFLKGYSSQSRSTVPDILRFLYHPLAVAGCTTSSLCIEKRLGSFEHLREVLTDPTIPLDIWTYHDWDAIKLCLVCRITLTARHNAARQQFWDNLPGMYGLPEWEKLEELKEAAIGSNIFA
ncbi:hypothetical protein C8R46DRAFT_1064708 [Mycena filopes]|nr:hypothetical protein C8R46DRAFT_1064708 [Mycena filopes]